MNKIQLDELRKKAEMIFLHDKSHASLTHIEDVRSLLEELNIYQIELEMQNNELQKTNEELNNEREKYKNLYDKAPLAYFTINENGNIYDLNVQASKLLGKPKHAFNKTSLFGYLTDESKIIFTKFFKKVAYIEDVLSVDIDFITFSSEIINTELSASSYYDHQYKETLFRCSVVDITPRKNTEKALLYAELKLRKLIDHIPDTLFLIDKSGKILDFYEGKKQVAEEVTDFTKYSISDIIPKDIEAKMQNAIEKTLELGYFEEYFERKMDRNYVFLSKFIKFNDTQVLMLRSDITKLVENERLLKKLIIDKDRFMCILAHDLKNPFNTLLGFTSILQKNIHKYELEKTKQHLKIIEDVSYHTYTLLEDLLLWSRSQSGALSFSPSHFLFYELCHEIIQSFVYQASLKNIAISFLGSKSVSVYADKDMVKTIIRNLLSNAIKFSNEKGIVTIALEVNTDTVSITVSDNGIGMSEDEQAQLWDEANPYTKKGTAQEKGTGLGLLLCKEFVEKNGGIINLRSIPQEGTTVTFTLDYKINTFAAIS